MNVLDIILSTEVITGVLIVGSLVMTVRTILLFTREAPGISTRLLKVETDLATLSDRMGEKKRVVRALNTVVTPLREREEQLRSYFDRLRNMELEHDRAAQKAEEEEELARKTLSFSSRTIEASAPLLRPSMKSVFRYVSFGITSRTLR